MLLFYGMGTAKAQEPQNVLDILTSTAWIHDCSIHGDDAGTAILFSFEKKTGRQTVYQNGLKVMDISFRYYLSDKRDERYNKAREGKTPNGRYIIFEITDFGDNFFGDAMKDRNDRPANHLICYELLECKPGQITIPFVGVTDVFVPCSDLAAEMERLENNRTGSSGK